MRRALLPFALLFAVVGCTGEPGDPDDSDDGRGRPPADLTSVCDDLGEDDVSALVGVPVTRKTDGAPGGTTCTFSDDADDGLVTVFVLERDGSWETLKDLAEGPAEDVDTAPLEIDGADEALVVDSLTDTLVGTSMLAREGDRAYTVYPTGLTRADELRIGTAVLRLLLGGEPDPADAVDRAEVPHPCEQLTQAEARKALGAPVEAARADNSGGTVRQCVYDSPGLSVSVIDLGRTNRVDNAASPIGGDRGTEVPAPAPLTAYRPTSSDYAGSELFVATDRTVLTIQVEAADDAESQRLAETLLPALA